MQFQCGQAMVEYAILFIVLSILFIGGAELGMAALASYKNTDAAKTGISEYAEVNQRRLNILNAEKQYLISLSGFNCRKIPENDPLESCAPDTEETGIYENFIRYMDDQISDLNDLKDQILTKYIVQSCPNYTGTGTESNWNDNAPDDDVCTISEDELNLVTPANQSEGQDKFKVLLLISHIKLSKLPLDSSQPLSQAKIVIGDHASPSFSQPLCNSDGSYDDGLPIIDLDGDGDLDERYVYREYTDVDNNRQIYETGNVLYLFNPLPIDVSSCQGTDSARNNQSKLSILVGGYGKPDDPLFVPGLPKLNQAMYGMYKNDLNGNLIPPGKMCTSDDDCPNQPNEDLYIGSVGPSGYYRWNKGSDGSGTQDLFKYTVNNVNDDLLNGFRPAMQIDCNVSSNHEESVINDINCQTLHSKVRIHTRYRKIFEGFLTFGLQELNVADGDLENALKLFYNPNNVGVAGSNQLNGTIDSEIGSLGANGIPTVKRHKDFRGCYEVDVATNQISACN